MKTLYGFLYLAIGYPFYLAGILFELVYIAFTVGRDEMDDIVRELHKEIQSERP